MPAKGSAKGRYNFLIDSSVYDEFSAVCDELGLIRSKKLEHFMKEFAEKNKDAMKRKAGR